MKKILYFECASGISGDMTLGALLDLGVDKDAFLAELKKLSLDGYHLEFETVERNGICANHVNVVLEDAGDHHHHDYHDHHHNHHHHDHHHHDHHHHDHHHDHEQEYHHEHTHVHRSFRDIRGMIQESPLEDPVKDLAIRIFTRVAEAEAKVHGKTIDEVHFHEVGAVDSIVDIVGCAILIHMIQPDEIYASVVQDGHGFIRCQHGLLSVPVPAVSEIFAASDVILRQIDVETELVTPTGAAIIAELAESFGRMPMMKLDKIGWGAGTKILSIPNVLKVYQGLQEEELCSDQVAVIEANLDDCTGEMLGAAMELLMSEGALDVFYTPIYMKKNRPAWKLTVLAKPDDMVRMERLIFLHTTTIGVRKRLEDRSVLKRKKVSVETPYGICEAKRVELPEGFRDYPEYESAAKLAREHQVPLWEVLNFRRQ